MDMVLGMNIDMNKLKQNKKQNVLPLNSSFLNSESCIEQKKLHGLGRMGIIGKQIPNLLTSVSSFKKVQRKTVRIAYSCVTFLTYLCCRLISNTTSFKSFRPTHE